MMIRRADVDLAAHVDGAAAAGGLVVVELHTGRLLVRRRPEEKVAGTHGRNGATVAVRLVFGENGIAQEHAVGALGVIEIHVLAGDDRLALKIKGAAVALGSVARNRRTRETPAVDVLLGVDGAAVRCGHVIADSGVGHHEMMRSAGAIECDAATGP